MRTNPNVTTQVITQDNERFTRIEERPEGVEIPGGKIIPWPEVVGFRSYYRPLDRWMFIPV